MGHNHMMRRNGNDESNQLMELRLPLVFLLSVNEITKKSRSTDLLDTANVATLWADEMSAHEAMTRRKSVRKEQSIRVRLTLQQKRILAEAAAQEGLGVSSWLLAAGLRAAAKIEMGPSS
jgi:hypothetical protein